MSDLVVPSNIATEKPVTAPPAPPPADRTDALTSGYLTALAQSISESPSSAPPPPDPYEEALKDYGTSQGGRLAASIYLATHKDPKSAATQQRISRDLGIPVEAVESNQEEFEQLSRELRTKESLRGSTALRELMANPDFASTHYDLAKPLWNFERVLGNAISGTSGFLATEASGVARGIRAAGYKLDDLLGTSHVSDENSTLEMLAGVGDRVGEWSRSFAPKQPTFGDAVLRGLFQMVPQIATMAVNPGAALVGLYGTGVQQGYENIQNDPVARAASRDQQYNEMLVDGLVTGATEWAADKLLLDSFQTLSLKSTFRDLVFHIARGGAAELTQEAAEEFWQQIAHIAYTNPESKLNWDAIVENGMVGGVVGALVGAAGRAFHGLRAQRIRSTLSDLGDAAKADGIREAQNRDPRTIPALVNTLLSQSEGAISEVFVDKGTLNQVMLDNKISAKDLDKAYPEIGKQLESADHDVVIPLATYSQMAGADLGDLLAPHIRPGRGALSMAESVQAAAKAPDFNATATAIDEKTAERKAWNASVSVVQDKILTQLNATKVYTPSVSRVFARWTAALYENVARRTGKTPEEVFAAHANVIEAGPTTAPDAQGIRYNQETGTIVMDENLMKWFGKSEVTAEIQDGDKIPSLFWHYSDSEHEVFKETSWSHGPGFYLSRNSSSTRGYGKNEYMVFLKMENPLNLEDPGIRAKTFAEVFGKHSAAEAAVAEGAYGNDAFYMQHERFQTKLMVWAKENKYDGVVFRDSHGMAGQDVSYVVFDPTHIKAVENRGTFDPNDPNIYKHGAGGRKPWSAKMLEDPLFSTLFSNLAAAEQNPKALARNLALLEESLGFPKHEGEPGENLARRVEAVVNHMADNILFLYNAMSPELRERARKWYDGAYKLVAHLSNRHGISEMQGAAVVAVLSPKTDWFANVAQAVRLLDIFFAKQDHRWDAKMTKAAKAIMANSTENGGKPDSIMRDLVRQATSKTAPSLRTLREVIASGTPDALAIAARWTRAYDMAYNERGYQVITPEGGTAGYRMNLGKKLKDGTRGPSQLATMSWGGYDNVEKALGVLADGSSENIAHLLGSNHKVRNFYNNILHPESRFFLTVDTHAVAADHLMPFAGEDLEPGQAFGAGGGSAQSADTGVRGTYSLHMEAYTRAADRVGILPREMQSITWEAVRGLFEAKGKTEKAKEDAAALREAFREGKISADEMRAKIFADAGGIADPSWANSPESDDIGPMYEGESRAAMDAIGPLGAAENPNPSKVVLEVAPDPTDTAALAIWTMLPKEVQRAITLRIGQLATQMVMDEFGTSGTLSVQYGGYKGFDNVSLTLTLEDPSVALGVAKMLGHVLRQEMMMVVSGIPSPGLSGTGLIQITLPAGYGQTDIETLHAHLYELTSPTGANLVGGHTTTGRHMLILHDASAEAATGMTTDAIRAKISEKLADVFGEASSTFDVSGGTAHAAFPEKGDYGYATDGTNAEARGALAGGKPSGQRSADFLREAISKSIRDEINAARIAGLHPGDTAGGNLKQQPTGAPPAAGVEPGPTPGPPFWVANPRHSEDSRSPERYAVVVSRERRDSLSYEFSVLPSGHVMLEWPGWGELTKHGDASEALRNFLSRIAEPAMPPGEFWRFTNNKDEQDLIARGEIRESWNHVDNFREKGLSVASGAHYSIQGYRYGYLVRGDVVGYGSDGEPLLDVRTLRPLSKVQTAGDIGSKDLRNRDRHLRKVLGHLGVPRDYYDALRSGNFKLLPEEPQLLQKAPQSPGASVPPRGSFVPSRLATILHEKADWATFIHETGHLFLEIYTRIASDPSTSEKVRADVQGLMDWFGVKDINAWNAMSLDEKRQHHEAFTYNFEIYAYEGRAPSIQMQSIYERFRAWLKRIYRDITEISALYEKENGKPLPIMTGEVKSIMDRMLASDEQIAQAEAARGMRAKFQTKPEGMSDAEWKAYQDMNQEATESALADLTASSVRDVKWLGNAKSRILKTLQGMARGARAAIRADVTREVEAEPLYKAAEALDTAWRHGRDAESSEARKARLAAKREFEAANPGATAPEPVSIEEQSVADAYSVSVGTPTSVDELRAAIKAAPKKQVIEDRTDQRMLDEHAEMEDLQAQEEFANMAVHNENRARVIGTELRFTAKLQQPVRVLVEAARQAARSILGSRAIGEIRPKDLAAAETRASRAVDEAMRKGDDAGVVRAMERRLLAHQMAAEALKIQGEVQKANTLFKKIFTGSDEKLGKSRDTNYVNAARAILASFGLGKADKPPAEYLANIKKYDPEFYQEIEESFAPVADPKPVKDLTLDEFRDLADQVGALWHLSRRQKQMLIDGQLVERKAVVQTLIGQITKVFGIPDKGLHTHETTDKEKHSIFLLGAKSALRRVEAWTDGMDLGDMSGPFRKFIWQPVSESITRYRIAKGDAMKKYLEIMAKVGPFLKGPDIVARDLVKPGSTHTFTPQQLLHAILHTGNDSNLKKLLVGKGWGDLREDGSLDRSRWDAFIAKAQADGTLTKDHYEFAQSVWNLMESLKPAAWKAHYDMYGFYPGDVTANPVVTPWGTFEGGYVPARTDPFQVPKAAMYGEKELGAVGNSYSFPTTGRGATKSRVENYNKPLLLDLRALGGHIDWSLRFTHVEPAIKDVARIVKTNAAFGDALAAVDPTLQGDMLVPWLQRAATQMIAIPTEGKGGKLLDRAAKYLRATTGMQMMVLNVSNTLQQFTGLSISALKVPPSNLLRATWRYIRQPGDTASVVSAKSDFMRNHLTNYQFEAVSAIDEMLLNPGKFEQLQEFAKQHGYVLQSMTQGVVDTITWTGAYDHAISTGADEKAAVRAADSAVRETQGSFAPEDISRFEGGTPVMRLFTQFFSYFNMQANVLGTEFLKVHRDIGVPAGAGKLFFIYVTGFMLPAVLSEVVTQAVGGFDTGDDDDWGLVDAMRMFFGSQARTAFAMVPVAGQVAGAALNRYVRPSRDIRISTSPAITVAETAIETPFSVYAAIAGNGSWKKASRDMLTTLGALSGLPLGQLGKPIGFGLDVAQGKAKPEGYLDWMRGLLSGKDVDRPKY